MSGTGHRKHQRQKEKQKSLVLKNLQKQSVTNLVKLSKKELKVNNVCERGSRNHVEVADYGRDEWLAKHRGLPVHHWWRGVSKNADAMFVPETTVHFKRYISRQLIQIS